MRWDGVGWDGVESGGMGWDGIAPMAMGWDAMGNYSVNR